MENHFLAIQLVSREINVHTHTKIVAEISLFEIFP